MGSRFPPKSKRKRLQARCHLASPGSEGFSEPRSLRAYEPRVASLDEKGQGSELGSEVSAQKNRTECTVDRFRRAATDGT